MVAPNALPPEFMRGVTIIVHQGDCLVSGETEMTFSTVLGSCVSACVRDTKARVGGMNHFLLAERPGSVGGRFGASARYGAYAMERLINTVLAQGSGSKANLEIKLFGGALINASLGDIGAKNIEFVRDFLANEGYAACAEDLGGTFARRVMFKPQSGRAFVRRLASKENAIIAREELEIAARQASSSDVELFGRPKPRGPSSR